MKKLFSTLAIAGSVLFFIACDGKNKEQEAIVAPEGMNVLDLTRYGKQFAIFIPDTTKAKLVVTEQQSGSLDISIGNNFAITINEQSSDIEMKKSEIKGDEVNKLKSFIAEEPTAIMWESEITKPEFHFLINQKIGTAEYSIEDLKSTDAEPFGKEAIQKMFDSAKNIKEIKKPEA